MRKKKFFWRHFYGLLKDDTKTMKAYIKSFEIIQSGNKKY